MFERYTEKARRVIFFARYEASIFGSPTIETEHLLLGLLREDRVLFGKLGLRNAEPVVRKTIEERTPKREPVSTSIDLPLAQDCKRVLAYAAEEAERLSHRHIGTEHLLLGLLREKRCVAAEILNRHGIALEDARAAAGGIGWEREGPAKEEQSLPQEPARLEAASALSAHCWREETCPERDALVEKITGRTMLHTGGEFDPERFDLRSGGWTTYHCAICWKDLPATPPAGPVRAFTNGLDWVCPDCHETYLSPPAER